ncbi:hypothetical protein BC455_22735 [Vibrio harveyi]|nr:hypothetical protein BC455_22735 [Vibrio harveyi]
MKCELNVDGMNYTRTSLHLAAQVVVNELRFRLGGGQVSVQIYPYRENEMEHIGCMFYVDDQNVELSITITGKASYISWDEMCVIDMAEGLHLLGIVTSSLSANVKLGLHEKEMNEQVLVEPLQGVHISGRMKLFD